MVEAGGEAEAGPNAGVSAEASPVAGATALASPGAVDKAEAGDAAMPGPAAGFNACGLEDGLKAGATADTQVVFVSGLISAPVCSYEMEWARAASGIN